MWQTLGFPIKVQIERYNHCQSNGQRLLEESLGLLKCGGSASTHMTETADDKVKHQSFWNYRQIAAACITCLLFLNMFAYMFAIYIIYNTYMFYTTSFKLNSHALCQYCMLPSLRRRIAGPKGWPDWTGWLVLRPSDRVGPRRGQPGSQLCGRYQWYQVNSWSPCPSAACELCCGTLFALCCGRGFKPRCMTGCLLGSRKGTASLASTKRWKSGWTMTSRGVEACMRNLHNWRRTAGAGFSWQVCRMVDRSQPAIRRSISWR